MLGLTQIFANLPFLAICGVAGALAVARWDKHPTASILVVTGVGIQVMTRVASLAVPLVMNRGSYDASSMGFVFTAIGIVSSIGFACLVAAVFADRDSRTGPPVPPFR